MCVSIVTKTHSFLLVSPPFPFRSRKQRKTKENKNKNKTQISPSFHFPSPSRYLSLCLPLGLSVLLTLFQAFLWKFLRKGSRSKPDPKTRDFDNRSKESRYL